MLRALTRLFSITIPKDKLIITHAKPVTHLAEGAILSNSKVFVKFVIDSSIWLNDDQKQQIKEMYPTFINKEGEFIITSQSKINLEHRESFSNERDAIEKLQNMINRACEEKKDRKQTGKLETDEQKKKKIEAKRARGECKANRKSGKYDEIKMD
jgi:protein subunit release factor B